MKSVVRLSLCSLVLVACSNNSNNTGKKDLSTSELDFATTDDLSTPADVDLSVIPNPNPDLSGGGGGGDGGGGMCTSVGAWPGVKQFGAVNSSYTYVLGYDQATGPNRVLVFRDYMAGGSTGTANAESYTSASTFNTDPSTDCSLCPILRDLDATGTVTKVYFAQGGSATSKMDKDSHAGRAIATGTTLHFVEWDFTNDVAVTNGGCVDIASASLDYTWALPTDAVYFYGTFSSTTKNDLGRYYTSPTTKTETFALGGNDLSGWDVASDGSFIVYGNDAAKTGRFDLYAADNDGAAPQSLIALTHDGRKVTAAKIAPDTSAVAFVSNDDGATAGGGAVYLTDFSTIFAGPLVTTTNTALNAGQLVWSRDAAFLAFTGDFTVDHKFQLYIYDVNNDVLKTVIADTEIVANGTNDVGVTNWIDWDSNNQLYFSAAIKTGTEDGTKFRLWIAQTDGSKKILPGTTTAGLLEQAGSFGISTAGDVIAYASLSATGTFPYRLYTIPAPAVGSSTAGTPTALIAAAYTMTNAAAGNPDFAKPLVWSHDDTTIAFDADYNGGNADYQLYVISSAGNTSPVRLYAPAATRDAKWLAWSPDDKSLAFTSDNAGTTGHSSLYVTTNLTMADQTLTPKVTVPATGNLVGAPPLYWVALP